MFLTRDELATLTARKRAAQQIDALRVMGIPYWVNAAGRPVVARSAIEGRAGADRREQADTWTPDVVRTA